MIDSISIVIPSYNESQNINEIYQRTIAVIKKLNIKKYELIFVENGSKDNSLELLKKINSKDKSVKIISLSRNFGYQSAIAVGLKYSENEYIRKPLYTPNDPLVELQCSLNAIKSNLPSLSTSAVVAPCQTALGASGVQFILLQFNAFRG